MTICAREVRTESDWGIPWTMSLHLRLHPPVVPDTDRPPSCEPGGFPHHAVRLIPMADIGPRLSAQHLERSPITGLHQAHDRLDAAREDLAHAKSGLTRAESASEHAVASAVQARDSYEQARADARRAELQLRKEQRRIEDAKLALRQAYEMVARLEGLTALPDEPATDEQLGAA
jgi:hypothetical protein